MCKFTVGTQKAAAGAAPRASANKMCACTEEHMCVHGAQTRTRAHTDGYTDGLFMPDLITVWLLADTVGAVSLSAQPVEPLMQQLLLQSSWRHEEEEEAMIDC